MRQYILYIKTPSAGISIGVMLKGASQVLVRDSSKFLKEIFLFCLWFITGKLCKQRLIQVTIRSTNTMLPLHSEIEAENTTFTLIPF